MKQNGMPLKQVPILMWRRYRIMCIIKSIRIVWAWTHAYGLRDKTWVDQLAISILRRV